MDWEFAGPHSFGARLPISVVIFRATPARNRWRGLSTLLKLLANTIDVFLSSERSGISLSGAPRVSSIAFPPRSPGSSFAETSKVRRSAIPNSCDPAPEQILAAWPHRQAILEVLKNRIAFTFFQQFPGESHDRPVRRDVRRGCRRR